MLNYGGNEVPEKSNLIRGANGGILCGEDMRPAFGTNSCFDLQLWNGKSSYLSLRYGYMRPWNVSSE